MKTARQRFEAKYTKAESGCWDWRAGTVKDGYGRFWFNGKHVGAHRFSYEIYTGAIPEGLHILHKCDNPKCVNPEHIVLGTHTDNMADRNAKNRQAKVVQKGADNGGAKLTEANVLEIRELYATGKYHQKHLADMFGVSRPQISHVVNNKNWRHL